MASHCLINIVISAWETPKPISRLASPRSWCPAQTAGARVRRCKRVKNVSFCAAKAMCIISIIFTRRSPLLPAVHSRDDGCCEDVPLAVHRVQVLQHVRHLRERRESASIQIFIVVWKTEGDVRCVSSRTSFCFAMTAIEAITCIVSTRPWLNLQRVRSLPVQSIFLHHFKVQ